ncbi:MAG: DUF4391 domain-containing protein [Christensenellaceae bacterium]|jgi:hypothetical protein|nr:DUF4391 domain-containing protein [Christensenellaceae bacterium]
MTEIQVFAVSFKSGAANKRDLATIQKAIHYPILFTADGKSYFTIDGETFESDKEFISGDMLTIEKRSAKLTELYEDIAAAFISINRRTAESIADFTARYKRLQVLEREIARLQSKVNNEKQPNKRIEINEELKRLKAEQEVLRYVEKHMG